MTLATYSSPGLGGLMSPCRRDGVVVKVLERERERRAVVHLGLEREQCRLRIES